MSRFVVLTGFARTHKKLSIKFKCANPQSPQSPPRRRNRSALETTPKAKPGRPRSSVSPLTKPCVLAFGPVTFARLWRRCQLSGVSNGQASELNVLLFRHIARNGAFRQVRQCHQRRRTERFTFSVMCTHRTSQTSMCRSTDREDLERDREEIFPESENLFDDGHTRRHTSHRPTHMMTHATVSSDKMSTVIFLPHSISAPPPRHVAARARAPRRRPLQPRKGITPNRPRPKALVSRHTY
jgi:hypothetical protein